MIDSYFWLTAEQFSRLEPLLPTDTRGMPRVDDRRVISGIIHVLKSGGRWADAPDVRGGPARRPADRLSQHPRPALLGAQDQERPRPRSRQATTTPSRTPCTAS